MDLYLKASSRSKDIIVQEIDQELLVYDLKTHKALTLNGTAAKVWRKLDGRKTVSDIAESVQMPVELVLLSIEELQKKNLLSETVDTGLAKDRVSRRKMLTRLATSAVALPVIAAIVAPTSVNAQSGCVQPGLSPGSMYTLTNPAGLCVACVPWCAFGNAGFCCSIMATSEVVCATPETLAPSCDCTCL